MPLLFVVLRVIWGFWKYVLTFQTKTLMGEVMREAAFSLAEAKFAAGDFR